MALKAMIRKEQRTLLRDKQQLAGLGVFVLSLLFLFLMPTLEDDEQKQLAEQQATAQRAKAAAEAGVELPDAAAEDQPTPLWVQRWAFIGFAAGLCFYGSFFAIALALATFVGDKEEGTMEVLLATPLSDSTLYLLKFASVTVVASIISYLFLLMGAIYALLFQWELVSELPGSVIVSCTLLCLPLPLLFTGMQVGAGALCSVRAETTKGAGQIFGAVISIGMVLMFIVIKAVQDTAAKDTALDIGMWWVQSNFAVQVLTTYGLVLVITIINIVIGWSLFRRERLLT